MGVSYYKYKTQTEYDRQSKRDVCYFTFPRVLTTFFLSDMKDFITLFQLNQMLSQSNPGGHYLAFSEAPSVQQHLKSDRLELFTHAIPRWIEEERERTRQHAEL